MIKVLVVDDHPVVAEGLKQLLVSVSGMDCCGVALCGNDCKEILKTCLPDVILLDINLPDISGIDLCKYISEQYPSVKIIVITSFKEYFYVQKMIQNGAFGYLLKNALAEEIIEGIKTVYSGKRYYSDDIEEVLNRRKDNNEIYLTPRETDLLKLIVDGYTNKEIAEKLFLGVETVNSYRKNLLVKLGVKNTAAMVKLAVNEKLV
jgi:DNA-binding NarL/FixJ family response regulator